MKLKTLLTALSFIFVFSQPVFAVEKWLTEVPGQNRAWSNSNDGWETKDWSNSNSATTSITECKKAKRAYNFYHKKMKRGAFGGIIASALTGHSTFDSNKHDIYEIQRDNAEGFLEVNNCSAYGIYK
jgi:hypothetical protein